MWPKAAGLAARAARRPAPVCHGSPASPACLAAPSTACPPLACTCAVSAQDATMWGCCGHERTRLMPPVCATLRTCSCAVSSSSSAQRTAQTHDVQRLGNEERSGRLRHGAAEAAGCLQRHHLPARIRTPCLPAAVSPAAAPPAAVRHQAAATSNLPLPGMQQPELITQQTSRPRRAPASESSSDPPIMSSSLSDPSPPAAAAAAFSASFCRRAAALLCPR